MPTVARLGRLRVTIYPNDHRPAHVHVIGPSGEAVFELNCPEGPPGLRNNRGMSTQEINRIARDISNDLAQLCAEWSVLHGDY